MSKAFVPTVFEFFKMSNGLYLTNLDLKKCSNGSYKVFEFAFTSNLCNADDFSNNFSDQLDFIQNAFDGKFVCVEG